MTIRCGCPDDENAQVDGGFRDSIVFGPCNTCRKRRIQDELDRLEREEPTVAEAMAGMARAADRILGRLPSPMVAAIYDLERPYEQVLSDVDGDLG